MFTLLELDCFLIAHLQSAALLRISAQLGLLRIAFNNRKNK